MSRNYKAEAVVKLAKEISEAGFRVFIAKSGNYGFYTDAEGTRVVSFQYDLAGYKFSGNYKAVNVAKDGRSVGQGWIMGDYHELNADQFKNLFASTAPHWATKGLDVTLTTLAEHLDTYQKSSFYVEYPELPAVSITHYGMTEAEARAKAGHMGSFEGPKPICGNGSYHAIVTHDKEQVNCAVCRHALGI